MAQVAVIGLGKLGLPLAALMATRGHEVRAFDAMPSVRRAVRSGTPDSREPDLLPTLQAAQENLHVVDSIFEAIHGWAESSYIIVPTESLPNGAFDVSIVKQVVASIGQALKPGQEHVVDIVSTVMPGDCESVLVPELFRSSGRTRNSGLALCYNPEFIALGSVIRDMEYPDMQLLGAQDDWAADHVSSVVGSLALNEAPLRILSLHEAELVKLAVNNFVTMKVSFANLLGMYADKVGSIDIDRVTSTLGLDSRIGAKYLRAGAPFGGPCFPRDGRALAHALVKAGIDPALPDAVNSVNHATLSAIGDWVRGNVQRGSVCLLGAAYKPASTFLGDSPTLELAELLRAKGLQVTVWDPLLGLQLMHGWESRPLGAIQSDNFVVMTTDAAIRTQLRDIPQQSTVLDVWRVVGSREVPNGSLLVRFAGTTDLDSR